MSTPTRDETAASQSTTETATSEAPDHDRDYAALLAGLRARLAAARGPLFTTDADVPDSAPPDGPRAQRRDALFDLFLDGLDPALRQEYTCSACRRFVRRFGGLVTIDENGRTAPLFWDAADGGATFGPALKRMRDRVSAARVTGVFLSAEPVWGTPEAGGWTHFGGPVDASLVHDHALLNAGQRMAALAHDRETLERALGIYDQKHVKVALRLLDSEQLYRSEKVLGVAKWLDGLMQQLPGGKKASKKSGKKKGGKKARRRANLLWRAAATAPPGFCHVRSTMIGTLLDDIAAGKRYDDVARAFAAKMHPLQYQRPQAAPKKGNIQQAEKIIAQLGSAGALKRRLARLDDLDLLWRSPTIPQDVLSADVGEEPAGVFDHLKPGGKGSAATRGTRPTKMTWVKFRKRVLPNAGHIELLVPERGGFYAFVTAAEPDAPPIIQWDDPKRRNPVTWYTYMEPKPAREWGLTAGWQPLTGVCLFPHMWADEDGHSHQGKGALFVIRGCVAPEGGGSGLFPEFLRSEYRAVRATMEAFSKAATLSGRAAAGGCGLAMRPGSNAELKLRVHPPAGEPGGALSYIIDRWD